MMKLSQDNKATESSASKKQALTRKNWQTPVILEMDYTSTESATGPMSDGPENQS